MIEKILRYIPFTTCIIVYLFICGGFYLIGFWTTFSLDFLSFISLTEIPKSFLLPFAYSIGLLLLGMGIGTLTDAKYLGEKLRILGNKPPEIPAKKGPFRKFNTYIIIFAHLIVLSSIPFKNSLIYWVVVGLLTMIVLVVKTTSAFARSKLSVGLKDSPLPLLTSFLNCLVIVPVMSFTTGKIQSLKIYNNIEVRYINTLPHTDISSTSIAKDDLPLKFVGFLGDKLIVSSLNNEKIFAINQSSYERIELTKPKEKFQ